MDIETFDFESRVGPDVRTVIADSSSPNYTHEDLWLLIKAWYDNAEHWDNETLGQCAYELSALIGPRCEYADTLRSSPEPPDRLEEQFDAMWRDQYESDFEAAQLDDDEPRYPDD